jgi:hypothetical protein
MNCILSHSARYSDHTALNKMKIHPVVADNHYYSARNLTTQKCMNSVSQFYNFTLRMKQHERKE